MGELINLGRVKKAVERTAKKKTAAANRTARGTPKQLRKLAKAERLRVDQKIEAHKLDREKQKLS